MNPCTKGIYVWGRPIVVEREEEGPMSILLVDTEGIGSIQQDQTYDVKIFSLAVLLSSYFVYNSMSIIDERALDGLSLVVNLTKQISVRSHTTNKSTANSGNGGAKSVQNGKGGKSSERASTSTSSSSSSSSSSLPSSSSSASVAELGEYFPHFLWLLRDFALDLVDERGTPITSSQYLEQALRERPESSAQQSKNAIRSAIKNLFRDRDCVTLVRPVVDERQLKTIDSLPYNQLRPEFREQSEELVQKILDEVPPKQIHGHNLTGDSFVQLLRLYVQAINSGAVASIQSAWESLSAQVNQQAQEEAFHAWTSGINARYNPNRPLGEEHLQALHLECINEAFGVYDGMCYQGPQANTVRKQLKAKMAAEFAKLVTANREASTRFVLRLLNSLYEPLEARAKASQYPTFDALLDAWTTLKKTYFEQLGDSQASRLVAYDEFIKFYSNNLVTTAGYVARAIKDEHAQQIETWRKRHDALQSEKHALDLASVKAIEENKHLKAQNAAAEKNTKQLEMEATKASERLADAQRQLTKVTADLAKTSSELAKATAEVKIAQNQAQTIEAKLNAEVARLVASLADKSKSADDWKREFDAMKKKLSTAELELAAAAQSREKSEKLASDYAKQMQFATREAKEQMELEVKKAKESMEIMQRERREIAASATELEKDRIALRKKVESETSVKDASIKAAQQLQELLKARDAEVNELKKQIANASKQTLAEVQRTQQSANESQAQLKKLQDMVSARKGEMEDERRAKEVALAQLDELHQRYVDEVEKLNASIEMKNAEMARLRREVEGAKRQAKVVQTSSASIATHEPVYHMTMDQDMYSDAVEVEQEEIEKPRAKIVGKASTTAKRSKATKVAVSEPVASSSADIDIPVIVTSFDASASAKKVGSASRGGKKTSSTVSSTSAMDIDMVLPAAPMRKRTRPSEFSETAEVAAEEVGTPSKKPQNDASKMDKATLKSKLTAFGVKLPPGDNSKQYYVDLYNEKIAAKQKK